jgi:hypothetical protein
MVPTGVSRKRKRTRAAPSDRSPSRWQRARSPLSTGCPGPFHAQPPVQPDLRRRPLSPSPMSRRPRERLDADAPRHDIAPNLTSLSVRLASPVLDRAATYPGSRRCQPRTLASALLGERVRLRYVAARRNVRRPAGPATRARPAVSAHLPPSVAFVRPGPEFLSAYRENLRALPTCTPWFRGMDHPTWRHEILSAPASAADAVLPLRR